MGDLTTQAQGLPPISLARTSSGEWEVTVRDDIGNTRSAVLSQPIVDDLARSARDYRTPSRGIVDMMLAQVKVDRATPYWSERQEQLDSVQAYLESLADWVMPQPPKPSEVEAQVTVVEYANLGDSAAFIRKPLKFDPDETVGHLLDRAHGLGQPYRYHQAGERVELQVIQETVPETKASTDPWAPPF